MTVINVHEAKTHLSRILQRVSQGETIVIARNGRPIAKLVAIRSKRRTPGRLKGRVRMKADFDAPLPDPIARAFRGDNE